MDARSPSTPYGQNPSQYKVNVSRQKTRKWVEAKTQNYDGDDWGAEDEFDDDDNDDDTGPQLQRHVHASLGILRIVAEPEAERADCAGKTAGCDSEECDRAARIAYPYTTPDTDVADTTDHGANGTNWANYCRNIIIPTAEEMGHEKEKEQRSSSDSAQRPSLDSIGRNDGETETSTKPPRRPSFGVNDNGDGSRGLRPLEPVAERKSEYGFDGLMVNPGGPPPPGVSNNVEPGTARGAQGSTPTTSSQPQLPTLQHPQARKELASGAEPMKRYSTSPKLPLLSRLSGFGGDFLGGLMSDSPKEPNPPAESTPEQPQTSSMVVGSINNPAARNSPSPSINAAHPTSSPPSRNLEGQSGASGQTSTVGASTSEPKQANPIRPSFPGGWVTETATPAEMATPSSEQDKYGGGLFVKASDVPGINEQSRDAQMRPAPLRTPSPSGASAGHAGDEGQHNKSGRASPANLPSFRTSPSPRPTGERSASQEASGGATPLKDNLDKHDRHQPTSDVDTLGIAPLQPRKGSTSGSTSPQDLRPHVMRVETYSTTDNSSPLKESDFLRDEIMRSLSPARPAGDGLKGTPQDEGADRESAYLSDVYGDYWSGDDNKPEAATIDEQRGRDAGGPEPTPMSRETSGTTPTLPAPAWTSEPPTTSAEPATVPAVEPEAARSGLNRDRFSWEMGNENKSVQSSATKTSLPQSLEELTSAISAGPPDLALPTLNFDESNSRAVSAISTAPPGHPYSTAEPSSPVSNTGDRENPYIAPGENESKMFYPEDKVLLQSPMSPMSPMEPIGGIVDNEEEPTEAAPEGVPLPRSPSPTKPRSQPTYSSLTLKQILQLPTPGDRVQKMREEREHLAQLDSGLSEWLAEMCSREQHENAMSTYNYALSGADAELWGTKGGARIPLNAVPAEEGGAGQGGGGAGAGAGAGQSHGGGGTNALSHMGRSASGSVNLGHLVIHSGQAGAKGKELLHSAGKLSKGLLSKGKNKLRERAESKKA
ncbi:hypothetical protein VSDG_07096 [Cytospora chrysosperma]|uniref:Uncharacterized protein n=1 Tax=Cytospora chrysosperma TaxID=252740 RepID=A0A423VV22_CYTCH|nr:hypothetical protein VSDG_07096 [Valsa sordida]